MAPKIKTAAQLATEAKMRKYAALPNGGKSAAQMATEKKMRSAAQQSKVAPGAADLAQVRDYYAKNGHVPTQLANESKRLYGEASAVDVGELGKRVAKGEITLAQAQAAVKNGTAGLDPAARRAGLAASVEIDPQIAAVQTQKRLSQEGYDRAEKEGQAATQRTVGEQEEIYRRLAEQLGLNQPKIAAQYDQGMQGIDDSYLRLQQSLDSNYGGAINATQNEATRLGLQPAIPEATGEMASDQAFLKGVAGVQNQGHQGTMMNQKNTSLSDLMAAMSQSGVEGAALSASTLRDYAKQSAAERFAQQQQVEEMDAGATALEATRRGRVYEGTQSIKQQEAQAAYEAEQDAIANAIAQQKANAQSAVAGSDVYRAETDRQYKQGQLGVAQADSMTKAQIAAATIGKTNAEKKKILETMQPGTPAYQELASKIALQEAQAGKAISDAASNKQNANTNAAKAAQAAKGKDGYGKGLAGANEYLSSTLGSQGGIATGQIVNHAYNKYPPSSDKNRNDENFKKALKEARKVIQKQTKKQQYHNAVDSAIAIAYGK